VMGGRGICVCARACKTNLIAEVSLAVLSERAPDTASGSPSSDTPCMRRMGDNQVTR